MFVGEMTAVTVSVDEMTVDKMHKMFIDVMNVYKKSSHWT